MTVSRNLALIACAPLLAGVLAACSGPEPDSAADRLARGLSSLDLSGVPLGDTTVSAADGQLAELTKGMDDLKPEVSVKSVNADGDKATATLDFVWTFDESITWSYETKAPMKRIDDTWQTTWSPAVVSAELTEDQRLVVRRSAPDRADILGAGGKAIVTARPVVRLGIDKTNIAPSQAVASARKVAAAVDIDPTRYASKVKAAGAKAFVEAIVVRQGEEPDRSGPFFDIPGANAVTTERPLAPTREFAAPILGAVGDVTAELVEKSKGRLAAGDSAGLSGLQARYDEQLRGANGFTVLAVNDDDRTNDAELHTDEPSAGEPLRTTLDVTTQSLAETVLSKTKPASALVAIRPSTGDILAAASGPGGKGNPTATTGRYAPGSTFKVVTSLAMLRSGLSPSTKIRCTPTITADGKAFKNYDDYPPGRIGTISFRDAVANSCNTAFISQRNKVSQDALSEAAASLGLGVDHDLGFPAYFGSVPPTAASETEHAASMIGQGKVLASPLAMASVAASVASGKTVVPRLLPAQKADDAKPSTPLTAGETKQLRGLMRAVVTDGSGAFLERVGGQPIGAKTGTAEYGSDNPPRTHTWMIATQGDLAVAVFVEDGESGSATAGPILERFLQAVR